MSDLYLPVKLRLDTKSQTPISISDIRVVSYHKVALLNASYLKYHPRYFSRISAVINYMCGQYEPYSDEWLGVLSSFIIINADTGKCIPLDTQFGFNVRDEYKHQMIDHINAQAQRNQLLGYIEA